MSVLCYQYEADRHCRSCATGRFGEDPVLAAQGRYEVPADAIDREGNTVTAIFDGDEWWSGGQYHEELVCGTCLASLDDHYDDYWCECEDGCRASDCDSCNTTRECFECGAEYDENDGHDCPEDNEDDHYVEDGCDCASCEAAAEWQPGQDECFCGGDILADGVVHSRTLCEAAPVQGALTLEEPALLGVEFASGPDATLVAVILPDGTLGNISRWEEADLPDNECRGDRSPEGWFCERRNGHAGPHAAFLSGYATRTHDAVAWGGAL